MARQNQIRSEWLSNPDDFWYTLEERFMLSCEAVAKLINGVEKGVVEPANMLRVSPQDIVIIDSLTYGMSLLIQSILSRVTHPGCAIILSNYTYNAVRLAVEHYASICKYPPEIFTVTIPFPLLNDSTCHSEIICAYETTLTQINSQMKTIVLGLLDHIVSLPSMLMPLEALTQLYRLHGVQEVVVDGAHVPGQLDISEILPCPNIDFYVANLHKWCFSPTTAAFIWSNPSAPSRQSSSLHHPIVSHSYGRGLFAECAMLGTKDYSAMLAVPAAISFLDKLGGIEKVRDRNHHLCRTAMIYLSKSWDTLNFIQPDSLTASMGMIGLPAIFGDTWEASEVVRLELRHTHHIVIQKPFPISGDRLYLRISAAIYNTWGQYESLNRAILEMVSRRTG